MDFCYGSCHIKFTLYQHSLLTVNVNKEMKQKKSLVFVYFK